MRMRRISIYLGASIVAISLTACQQKPAEMTMPPPEVDVAVVQYQPISITKELSGRTSPYAIAEVRARVDGIVQKRLFTEGATVKAGQPLFQIDPVSYQAALESKQAILEKAKANLTSQFEQLKRYQALIKEKAVSQQLLDNANASYAQAKADVAAAQADVKTAAIQLGYTQVQAPISGKIGRAEVTAGGYVQAGQATLLATIQQTDPMYVDVAQSSGELLALKRELASGTLKQTDSSNAEVRLMLDDNIAYALSGRLAFTDITVSPDTGSVMLRALFPNPQGELLPKMFVRAQLSQAVNNKAMLVPQQGITFDAAGRATALTVAQDNTVKPVYLKTAGVQGTNWIVTEGLQEGDRVIIAGLQKVKPGAPVRISQTPHTATAANPNHSDESTKPALKPGLAPESKPAAEPLHQTHTAVNEKLNAGKSNAASGTALNAESNTAAEVKTK